MGKADREWQEMEHNRQNNGKACKCKMYITMNLSDKLIPVCSKHPIPNVICL